MTDKAYFASECDSEIGRALAEKLGYVKPGEPYYQLQKNDALGVFENDMDAIEQALDDEAVGDPYAIEQLRLARTDVAVRTARRRRK